MAHTWQVTNPFKMGIHEGIDWGCPTGTPIYAMAAGTAFEIIVGKTTCEWSGDPAQAYGNRVRIRSQDDEGHYRLTYGHLATVLVKDGDRVQAGDLIGVSGHTGRSTGSHLHVHYQELNADGKPRYQAFYGTTDFQAYLDTAHRVKQPLRQLGVRAPVGGPAVALYEEPRDGAWTYARKLEADDRFLLVGKDNDRQGPQARGGADASPAAPRPAWWQIDMPEKPLSPAGPGVAATVPALTPATAYDVQVRATHGAAQGPWIAAQGATAATA